MADGSYIGLSRADRELLDTINANIRKEVKEDMPETAQIAKLTAKYGNADKEVSELR